MKLSRLLQACGCAIGTCAIASGLLIASQGIPVQTVLALPQNYNFLHAIPGREIALGFVCIVIGMTILALCGSAISSPLPATPALTSDEDARSGFFSSRSRFILFSLSLAVYALFTWAITTLPYSHLLIIPYAASLAGIGLSFRQRRPGSSRASCRLISCHDLLIMAALFFLTLGMNSHNLTSWYFSNIGDEGAFYHMARTIRETPHHNVFSYSGVYGKFPIADSYYTAAFLWLLGSKLWVWKFSCVAIHAATVALLYVLGKLLFGRQAGLLGALMLSFSHYFGAFDKIGYNNTHMCLSSVLVMLALAYSCITGSRPLQFLTGVLCGLLSFSIWGGLITLPIVAINVLFIYFRPGSFRNALRTTVIIGSGSVLAALPGILTNSMRDVQTIALNLNHGVHPLNDEKINYWSGLTTSIAAFFRNEWWGSHYVSGPLIDPVTGFLFLAGVSLLISRIKSWQSIFVLSWTGISIVLIVLSSRSNSPYITRLLYLLPPVMLVSGRALSVIVSQVSTRPLNHVVGCLCVLVAAMLNFQQLYLGTPLSLPTYQDRIAVMEVQSSDSPSVIYVSPGQVENTNMTSLLSSYAPEGVTVLSVTESKIRQSTSPRQLKVTLPEEAKIIAPAVLKPLLDSLVQKGVLTGPVSKVSESKHGDSVLVVNHRSSGRAVIPESFLPRGFKNILGMF